MANDASADEIKLAYRALARASHPDIVGQDQAVPMTQVNEAFRVLRDPDRRRRYDAELSGEVTSHWVAAPGDVDAPATPMMPRPLRGFPWMLAVAVMVVIFIVTALVGGGGGRRTDPVDGLVQVGSCVAFVSGGRVGEVGCDQPHDGTVAALIGFDQECVAGTLTFADPSVTTRVCVEPLPG